MVSRKSKTGSAVRAIVDTARLVTAIITILLASSFSQKAGSHGTDGVLPLGVEQAALSISLNGPSEMAYSNGQLYVIETAGMRTWSVDTVRQTATLVLPPPIDPYTDEKKALGTPFAIAVSYNGDVFVGDVGGRLAQINLNTHSAAVKRTGLLEKFPQIHAMAADPRNGTIVLTDRHAVLRWIPETDELAILAGSYYHFGFSGDGGNSKDAIFKWPQGLAIDAHGNILVADTENCRLRRIDAQSGTTTTVAGGTACQSSGDGRPANAAQLSNPGALAVDSHGNIFLSEGCRVRRIDPQGIITTYAGTGVCGFSGDGGLATSAMVNADGLAVDDNGNLYLSDYSHNRIRCIDGRSHQITTFAGNGLPRRVDALM